MNAVLTPANGVELQLQLFELFQGRFGRDVAPGQLDDLARSAREIAERCGFDSLGQYTGLLSQLPVEAPLLQALLQTASGHDASFFRDEVSTRSLRELVLPALIHRLRPQRTLRIWSAGCSTGEDLYSIAILLRELIADIDTWNLSLIGSDVDAACVDAARRAEYGPEALRALSEATKARCFERTEDGRYRVRARYRTNVHFMVYNLADPTEPASQSGEFDLILCRGVTAHMNARARETVRKKCAVLLRPEGTWISAPSDPVPTMGFVTVVHPGLFEHRPECRSTSSTAGATPRVESPLPLSEDERPTWRPSPAPPPDSLRPSRSPPSPAGFTNYPARERVGRGAGTSVSRRSEVLPNGALERPPLNLEAALESAQGFADRGQLERALWIVETALSGAPHAADGYLFRAVLYESSGDHERALADLRRVTHLSPSCADAYLEMGLLMLRGGSTDAAVRAFRDALALGDAQREAYADIRRVAARHLRWALSDR